MQMEYAARAALEEEQRRKEEASSANKRIIGVFDSDFSVVPVTTEPNSLDAFESLRTTFRGHHDSVRALSVDGAARRLYSASWDETVIAWDIATRTPLGTMAHGCWVNCVKLMCTSQGANMVITGSEDGSVTFWSPQDFLVQFQLRPTVGAIVSLAVANDLIFAAALNAVFAISASTGSLVRDFRDTSGDIHSVAATDETLFTGSETGRLLTWDVLGAFVLREMAGHTGAVRDILVSDHNSMYTCGDDCKIKIWTMSTGVCLKTLAVHLKPVTSLALHQGERERYLYSGSLDGTVRCTRLSNLKSVVVRGFTCNALCNVHRTSQELAAAKLPSRRNPKNFAESDTSSAVAGCSVKGTAHTQDTLTDLDDLLFAGDYSGRIQQFSLGLSEKRLFSMN